MAENKDEEAGKIDYADESKSKDHDAYSNLARGLTSEELSQTGTQKLILNDLSKAEATIKKLEPFRDKYYDVNTEKCVLAEKLAKTKKAEILYSLCITSGGLIIGFGKSYLQSDNYLGEILFILGGLLVLGGAVFKINFNK